MKTETDTAAGAERDQTGLVRVVRPTLIAAIGGTGTSALKAARARIESLVGPKHHYIAFRAFDTSFQDSSEPLLIDNSEYIYLGGFNAQAVISDIVAGKAFPHWAEWLPQRLNFQQVAFGAGGIRPIGRLCYFYRRDRVEHAVQEALTTITDADQALRYHQQTGVRVNVEAGIDIHVVCSVCGGTGSGMFLDLAFDLRRWAEEHTDREVTVTGHLVLPEAFRSKPVVLQALEANTFVALEELDRFMNATVDDPWRVEYAQGRVEESKRAPFDNCYLLSGLQQGGTSDVEALTAIIGEAVTILSLSQVGQKVSEGVINMAGQKKSSRDQYGRTCCYSSYGLLGLEIPAALLADSLGPRLALQARDRLSLDAPVSEAEVTRDREAFREAMRLRVERVVQKNVPEPTVNTRPVHAMLEDHDEKHEAPRRVLQEQLVQARQAFDRELRRDVQKPLWNADHLSAQFHARLESTLLQPGGLDRYLKYLTGALEVLREFQQELRLAASEAESEAEASRSVARRIESGSISDRRWTELWQDERQWKSHQQHRGLVDAATEQAFIIDRLADAVQRDHIDLWRRIKVLFETLHLKVPRDEDSYYRGKRARTSVCPLSYFLERLEPHRENLLRKLLDELVEDVRQWASLSAAELNDRFYRLCTRVIHDHFAGESGMDCDRLLADCYNHPSEQYKTEVAVLLARARANWELHASYPMRTNLLEIAAIGVGVESTLYETLQEGAQQISTVEEQRADYVPILRTEHGMSLVGLKRLPAYRESLVDAVTQEQRFDFHFFSDRRWITQMELPGEDSEELRRLYVFTAANLLKLISKIKGTGYVFKDKPSPPLGKYRWEAFKNVERDAHLLHSLGQQIDSSAEADRDWYGKLESYIGRLEKYLDTEISRSRGEQQRRSEGVMSRDVYQIHSEIRALRAHMRIEDLGL